MPVLLDCLSRPDRESLQQVLCPPPVPNGSSEGVRERPKSRLSGRSSVKSLREFQRLLGTMSHWRRRAQSFGGDGSTRRRTGGCLCLSRHGRRGQRIRDRENRKCAGQSLSDQSPPQPTLVVPSMRPPCSRSNDALASRCCASARRNSLVNAGFLRSASSHGSCAMIGKQKNPPATTRSSNSSAGLASFKWARCRD